MASLSWLKGRYPCSRHYVYILFYKVIFFEIHCTVNVSRITHRIWKETNMQPSRVRSSNPISCCLLSLHFPCDILLTFTVSVNFNSNKNTPLLLTLMGILRTCAKTQVVYLSVHYASSQQCGITIRHPHPSCSSVGIIIYMRCSDTYV